ncbi:MAG TPA: TlyA family RNA methyltransferase [Candidatus Saccharimonadales bacterium]
MKYRLDLLLVKKKLIPTRSQAENWVKLAKVTVNGKVVTKPGFLADETARLSLKADAQYVSRAGLKLASVAEALGLHFQAKVVLDVGSSTGGFTDYALQHGAKKVIAVDVGTNQLHPSLRTDPRIDLYEKTDIRNFKQLKELPDIIVIDVSFISLREIIPHLCLYLLQPSTQVVAMVKPQFEAGKTQVNKGVIKNDTVRRQILKEFEAWVKRYMIINAKADSEVTGAKGNRERFYLLTSIKK